MSGLSRRGMIGGLAAVIAAPAVIRTPGLLMPIKPFRSRSITLLEFARRYGEETQAVATMLTENNRILGDIVWREASFIPAITARLPAVAWRSAV